jgi:transposase
MAASFVNVDRNTPMLLPPDLRDWVDEDDLVHFVIEACERLPLESFQVNHRGSGSSQMPPHMMLALLVCCYSNGILSSRKIERATYRDVAVRYLTADTHPDHDTICKFRRENKTAISAAFIDILELARSLGLLTLGKVSTDGTHIKANASIDQNVTYDRAIELRQRLQGDIAELMAEAEKADVQGQDDQSLPEEIARREALKAKMDQAIAELEIRAAKRRDQAQKDYQAKIKARKAKKKAPVKSLEAKHQNHLEASRKSPVPAVGNATSPTPMPASCARTPASRKSRQSAHMRSPACRLPSGKRN